MLGALCILVGLGVATSVIIILLLNLSDKLRRKRIAARGLKLVRIESGAWGDKEIYE